MAGETLEPDFKAIFEATPGLFLVMDADFVVVAVNDAHVAGTNSVREEVVGKLVFDAFPENPDDLAEGSASDLRTSLERVRDTLKPDTMAVLKYDIERPAEEGGGFEVRYWTPVNSPILNDEGELRYIFNRVEDVTEFVQLEEKRDEQAAISDELRVRTARMEREILARSRELQTVNKQLRAASEAKNEFLSRMSHELRTPLTAIVGFSELLVESDLDERRAEWVSTIFNAGEHLADLVDEVLDFSRIESGDVSIALESVDLSSLLREVLELMQTVANDHGITLVAPTLELGCDYVYADRQRLKQILINLLSNAVKYNREGGEARITVTSQEANRLLVTVQDTGHGLDQRALNKLFIPFERLDAANSGIEGNGIGLALSRKLAELMGGHLTAESTPGKGSSFVVELPRGEAVKTGGEEQQEKSIEVLEYASPRTLLYVEDTPVNIALVEEVLTKRPSIELLKAERGLTGLNLARERQPDMILLDLHLPDFDGDEVFARLQADDKTKDIPVVMLSADVTKRKRASLLADGVKAYLTKPVRARRLLETVDQFLDDEAAT